MKIQSFLNILLAAIIVVMGLQMRSTADNKEIDLASLEPSAQPCNYTSINGFAEPEFISRESASATANAYVQMANSRSDDIYGGVLSKSVLDSLMCGGNFNGIAYRLATDPTGRILKTGSVFIIVGGVKIENDKNGNPVIVSASSNNYSPNLWCPTNCLNF
ncbi:MAG TPA: hypothetical protein VFW78_06965 [Bacteroidia bacterium]|nr:hypothetical protein [Bacteroidia bacterium]